MVTIQGAVITPPITLRRNNCPLNSYRIFFLKRLLNVIPKITITISSMPESVTVVPEIEGHLSTLSSFDEKNFICAYSRVHLLMGPGNGGTFFLPLWAPVYSNLH